MPTPRGLQIPYTEFAGNSAESPTEIFDTDGTTATRVLDVAWTDRQTAVAQLLGYSYVDQTPSDGIWVLRRVLPDYHPELPLVIARRVSIKGIGKPGTQTVNGGKVNTYTSARLTVEYRYPDFDVLEDDQITTEFDRYRTFEIEPCAEYLSPPQTGLLKWSQGPNKGQRFPGNVGYVMGSATFHWDWLEVPFNGIPFNTIRRRIGCVNSDTFAGCEPGTLLLMPPKIRRVNSPTQLRTWTISYFAVYVGQAESANIGNPDFVHHTRPGHNWFYDFDSNSKRWVQASVDGTFQTPGSMSDGSCLYNERPFRDLFNVNSG